MCRFVYHIFVKSTQDIGYQKQNLYRRYRSISSLPDRLKFTFLEKSDKFPLLMLRTKPQIMLLRTLHIMM